MPGSTIPHRASTDHSAPDAPRRATLWLAAGIVLALGLLISPFIVFAADYKHHWVPWAQATQGRFPWGPYSVGADYPPFILYLFTVLEAVRLWVGAAVGGAFFLILLKLPNLISLILCGLLVDRDLRGVLGARGARIAAMLLICSPVLFVNSALWGQYDVLLVFMTVSIVVALAQGWTSMAGAIFGLALVTKFQAIVAGPVLGVYLLRRFGMGATVRAAACGAMVMAGVVLPFLLAGAGGDVYGVFTQAVGRWPRLTEGAFNKWYLLGAFNELVLGMPRDLARSDARLIGGLISFKHLGLLLFVVYMLMLQVRVWRRPTFRVFLFAQVMSGLAFFMLPTEMHERYLVPAAALACILVVLSPQTLWLFIWLSVSATLNQLIILYRMSYMAAPGGLLDRATLLVAGVLAIGNMIAFLGATAHFLRISRHRRHRAFENAGEAILDPSDELPEAPQAMP